jgi:hypothetical protein
MDQTPFHIGITTNDLETSMRTMSAALGLSWTTPNSDGVLMHDVDGRAQVQPVSCSSREGPVHIDLIKGEPGSLWDAAAPGIHHLAYRTDDLPGDVGELERAGWRLQITLPDPEGRPSVFAYLVRDNDVRVELVEDAVYDDYISFVTGARAHAT